MPSVGPSDAAEPASLKTSAASPPSHLGRRIGHPRPTTPPTFHFSARDSMPAADAEEGSVVRAEKPYASHLRTSPLTIP
ncbi:hypothetical protein GCM10010381_40740 [Streptomyces xantholiticus]|nr:hypothetical protein GCM10010381_40740 [Streptomyces xantholiticus]